MLMPVTAKKAARRRGDIRVTAVRRNGHFVSGCPFCGCRRAPGRSFPWCRDCGAVCEREHRNRDAVGLAVVRCYAKHSLAAPRRRGTAELRAARQRQPTVAKGAVYDLREIFDRLNKRYFGGKRKATIEWARRRRMASGRTSINHGVCIAVDRLIRVHPDLDCSWVPPWFVYFVVYHEMLHLKIWPVKRNGKTIFHTPEFYAAEKKFSHFKIARRWERENLDTMLEAR